MILKSNFVFAFLGKSEPPRVALTSPWCCTVSLGAEDNSLGWRMVRFFGGKENWASITRQFGGRWRPLSIFSYMFQKTMVAINAYSNWRLGEGVVRLIGKVSPGCMRLFHISLYGREDQVPFRWSGKQAIRNTMPDKPPASLRP